MGRIAVTSHLVQEKLGSYVAEKKFRFGLLIGQPSSEGKDYIVYATQTQNHVGDLYDSEDQRKSIVQEYTIENLDPQLLVNHAVVVTRMIPGCFFVQGMFVVSEVNIFQEEVAAKKVRQCVLEINKILSDNSIFRSNTAKYDNGDKLILHCPPAGQWTCRTMNVNEPSASFKPADWKVYDKPVSWHLFETNYDIEEVFPLFINKKTANLEQNFLLSLKNLNSYLESSAIFIHHDHSEDNVLLEALLKVRREKKEQSEHFRSTVFFPATIPDPDLGRIIKVYGTIRYSGIVYSRIWAHPKTEIKDVKDFIRNDILRSLASRVQIYCDSLTESNVHEGSFIVSEPPRRVFIKVAGTGGIEFCEYLFRGELPEIVVDQAKEMLDLKITTNDVETDIEALPVYEDELSTISDESITSTNSLLPRHEVRKNMYLAGILGALVVLIVSLIVHFIR